MDGPVITGKRLVKFEYMASEVGIDPLDKGETALWRAVNAWAIEDARLRPRPAGHEQGSDLALRRQKSQVRILSGPPILSMVYEKTENSGTALATTWQPRDTISRAWLTAIS